MVKLQLSIEISRPPSEVFAFLRDKDTYPQDADSPVLVLEKTTPGPPGVGTRYREVVRMMSFYKGEILSVITRYEPGRRLEEDWWGPCMRGDLAYLFQPVPGGTRLVQTEHVELCWTLVLFTPVFKLMLGNALRARLRTIKSVLESR
jgi:hypothetical protein